MSYQQDLFRYVAEEFAEDYREGEMPRREFLRRSVLLGGSVAGARVLLASLGVLGVSAAELAEAQNAEAQNEPVRNSYQVAPDDPTIEAQAITYEALGRTNFAYVARPAGVERAPIVLVIHENRGLQPHIQDVTRRVAKAGYIALAPDFVSPIGGTAQYPDVAQISSFIARTPAEEHVAHAMEAIKVLKSQPGARAEDFGMVGFCWGGGMTWRLSTLLPDLKAAVPFYGPSPDFAAIPNIRAAVLGVYGGLDARITGNAAATEAALTAAGVTHRFLIYPGANHAFHNDTGQSYKRDAAENAWATTLVWFREHL